MDRVEAGLGNDRVDGTTFDYVNAGDAFDRDSCLVERYPNVDPTMETYYRGYNDGVEGAKRSPASPPAAGTCSAG